jgi:putative RecB family exonuclease
VTTDAPRFPIPDSLSPSRIQSFTSCPLAFRFASVEKIPDPPTIHTTKGNVVHRTLEMLLGLPSHERTEDVAVELHHTTRAEYLEHPDLVSLQLPEKELEKFWSDALSLVRNYFTMEDPREIVPEGVELRIEASMGDFTLRGIIDRLERSDEGALIITDYKTGRSPHDSQKKERMTQMMLYAWLCRAHFGESPASLRLMYVRDGHTIVTEPTEQQISFQEKRTQAIWKAIATSCTTGRFAPQKSALCKFCAYQKWCPEFGGNPDLAVREAPITLGGRS